MFKKMNEIRKSEEGFTMGEVLIAISVFSTLVCIAVPAAIGVINDDKNFSVEVNTINAITAIEEYKVDNGGKMPDGLGNTNYDKWDDDAKVNAVIKGNDICLVGWNNKGGDYTVETPYILLNGQPVTSCNF